MPPKRKSKASACTKVAVLALFLGTALYLTLKRSSGTDHASVQDAADAAGAIDDGTPAGVVAAFIAKHSQRGKAIMRKYSRDLVAVMELDQVEEGPALQDHLMKLTGARTVPRIFVDKQCLGGADDVAALEAEGKLATLLKEKGLLAAAATE